MESNSSAPLPETPAALVELISEALHADILGTWNVLHVLLGALQECAEHSRWQREKDTAVRMLTITAKHALTEKSRAKAHTESAEKTDVAGPDVPPLGESCIVV